MSSFRWILALLGFLAAAPAPALDLTFFTCSDTHYREAAASNTTQAALIDMMNRLPGQAYPAELGGGTVAEPRGVIIPGDLIDTGQGPSRLIQAQWDLWSADFGVHGEGRLRFPVYEGYGNHDLNAKLYVENQIRDRTLHRSNVVAVATNGLHYAWNWDGITFIQLNLYPGNTRPKGQPPRYALDFLREVLATQVVDRKRPVVISHHYVPTDTWWTDAEKEAYYEVIKDYHVILIIVGHQFQASVIDWKGIPVLDNNDFRGTGAFVVRIRDGELAIAQRSPADRWKLTYRKDLRLFP